MNIDDLRIIHKVKGTKYVIENYDLSDSDIERMSDILDWNILSTSNISIDLIDRYSNKINFDFINLAIYFKFTEEFIEKHIDKISFEKLSYREDLSIDFIRKHSDKFSWNILCLNKIFLESEIEEFINLIDWSSITISHDLSREFLDKHKDRIDIKYLKLQNVDLESENWIEYSKNIEDDRKKKEEFYNFNDNYLREEREEVYKKLAREFPKEILRDVKLNRLSGDKKMRDGKSHDEIIDDIIEIKKSSDIKIR